MRVWDQLVSNRWWSLTAVVALASVLLFVGLGRSGYWEPHEVGVVTSLVRNEESKATEQPAAKPAASDAAKPGQHAQAQPCPPPSAPLPLSTRIASVGETFFGTGEMGTRAPLALLGLLVVLLTWLVTRLYFGARAGLLAAVVALSFPAILFGSRQLTGAMPSVIGATMAVTGMVVLAWPPRGAPPLYSLLGALLAALGLFVGYESSGLLLGVAVPATAVALAGLAVTVAAMQRWRRHGELGGEAVRVAAITAVVGAVAIGAVLVFVRAVFDWLPAGTDDREILGHTLVPCVGATKAAMGSWRGTGDLEVNFDALLEQVAFGAFPWVALAPIAIGRLAFADGVDRKTLAGYALFAWTSLTWLVGGVIERKVGAVLYPALPGLAIGIGAWLAERWPTTSDDAQDQRAPAPLVALFVALAAIVLGKDIVAFPDVFTGLEVAGGTYTFPPGLHLHVAMIVFALFFAAASFAGIAMDRPGPVNTWPQRVARWGLPAALAVSIVMALFLSQVWTPLLSRKLSSRRTFDVLGEVRKSGEKLGILGQLGDGPKLYAGTDAVVLPNRNDLYKFLAGPERVFALVPDTDLCTIHNAAPSQGFDYFVLDDQNAKHLLISNRLGSGERDRNRLARTIVRSRPTDLGTPVSVNFEDQLELIGVRMPKRVARGDIFELTLIFEVKQRLRRNWDVFLHFDGASQRFQGDHKPADLFCPATQWRPGDFIVDTVELEAGGLGYPRGVYKLWVGLFTGSAGNWTNMKVLTPGADEADRFPVGVLEVE